MRRLALIPLLFAGACAPVSTACVPPDAGADVGVDAWTCPGRVVIGPVNVPVYNGGLPGISSFCSGVGGSIEFRARIFEVGGGLFPSPHGLVAERTAICGPDSDYLDLGELEPGEYDVAIENVVGNVNDQHVLIGADAIRPSPCVDAFGARPYHCAPIRLTVRPCGLSVASAALLCEDPVDPCFPP